RKLELTGLRTLSSAIKEKKASRGIGDRAIPLRLEFPRIGELLLRIDHVTARCGNGRGAQNFKSVIRFLMDLLECASREMDGDPGNGKRLWRMIPHGQCSVHGISLMPGFPVDREPELERLLEKCALHFIPPI